MNKEQLIEELMKQAEKIFFYCAKRCNSRIDAEDLSQDILLDIIVNINKGIEIKNFDYYIWKICKNAYSKYVSNKVTERDKVTYLEGINVSADNVNTLEALVSNEKITSINTAIKLLSCDYSEILYSYYVEDNTISYIAEKLNLPLGTIKRKLYDIRNKLKEYLKMERLNGKKAYVPKEFQVSMMSNNGGTYNPCSEVSSLIHKNLLYHSYNNPCTIEEYSLELGISRPYIEEIVNKLVDVTLLKKEGNKFITDFGFIDKVIIKEINKIKSKYVERICNNLKKIVTENIYLYKELIKYSDLDNDKLTWSLLLYSLFFLECRIFHQYHHTKRPGNGEWDFMMFEGEDIDNISVNGFGEVSYYGYTFSSSLKEDINYNQKALNGDENYGALFNLIRELDKNDYKEATIERYVKYLANDDLANIVENKVVINIPIIKEEDLFKINSILLHEENTDLGSDFLKMGEEIKSLFRSYLPKYLENQFDYVVSNFINVKSKIIKKFIEDGLLFNQRINSKFTYNGMFILKNN